MKTFFANQTKFTSRLFAGFLVIGFSLFTSFVSAGELSFAWDPSPSTNVGGYKLYYGNSSKGYTASVDVGNVTSYKMTGLTDGSTYFFALKSYNTAKSIESTSYSNEISATVAAPQPPPTTGLTNDFTLSATTGSAPFTVTVTPVTTGVIRVWRWDFPGTSTPTITGSTSVVQAQTVTYSTPGTYKIWLNIYGVNENKLTTKVITVTAPNNPAPVVTDPNVTTTTPTSDTSQTNSNGLVAAYGFEENAGNLTADASGKGNHGVLEQAVRSTSGFLGSAMYFDGKNAMLTVNDSASLDLSNGSTLEAWVKPAVTMSGWRSLILKEQSLPGGEIYSLYANGETTKPYTGVSVNGNVGALSGGTGLAPNAWWHLAATYDGTVQRLYINGVLVASRNQTGSIQQSNNPLRIGGNTMWGEYFNGLIDEVKIYNRALSGTEINTYFKAAIDPVKSDSVAIRTTNPPLFILGNKTLETFQDSEFAGTARAFKVTSDQKRVISALQVYLDGNSAATRLTAGIYADNAGHPGALLSQGTVSFPQANATNTVLLPTVQLDAGRTYWIAILGNSGDIMFRRQSGAANPMESSSATNLNSLPGTWSTGTVIPNAGSMSAYGTGY